MQNEIRNFIGWELASQDTIDFKKCYVDLADDLIAGLLLSQIVYWHLPSKDSGKTKLRVKKENHLWIAKGRNDWHDEIRITAKQYDRAIKILIKKDVVETKIFKFNSNPTTHVRLKWETFLEALKVVITEKNTVEALGPMVIDERGITNLTFEEQPNSPLSNNDIDETVISLTESNKQRIQTENTNRENPIPYSLSEEIFKLELPMPIRKKLDENREKILPLNIDVYEIERFYNTFEWIKTNAKKDDFDYLNRWEFEKIIFYIFDKNILVEKTTFGFLKQMTYTNLHFKKKNFEALNNIENKEEIPAMPTNPNLPFYNWLEQ